MHDWRLSLHEILLNYSRLISLWCTPRSAWRRNVAGQQVVATIWNRIWTDRRAGALGLSVVRRDLYGLLPCALIRRLFTPMPVASTVIATTRTALSRRDVADPAAQYCWRAR
jgi:hypothetical protein